MRTNSLISAAALLAVLSGALLLSGCGGEETTAPPAPVSGTFRPPALPASAAEAGIPVAPAVDPTFTETRNLAQAKYYGRRSDPFGLLASERTFEQAQQIERARSEYGGWFSQEFVDTTATDQGPQVIVEPQPYRRLSGILLGNGVSALIEMENGQVYEIVPGSQIPGTPWVVISIDAERAVLRRGGNRLPKEIIVRLGPSANQFTGGDSGAASGGGGRGNPDDAGAGGAGQGPRAAGAQGR